MSEQTTQKHKIWLDCDPGLDDAFAIILAGYNPTIQILGISTVHGNQTLVKTTNNALRILQIIALTNIKVVSGASKPILRPVLTAGEIHGESGLGDVSFSDPLHDSNYLRDVNAILYIYNTIMQSPEPISFIATGCLTNVALLITTFPEVKSKISKIVFMGGCIGTGNIRPVQEFNIYVDPESCKIVLECGIKLVQVSLQVTNQVVVTKAIIDKIGLFNCKLAEIAQKWLLFYANCNLSVFGEIRVPLHDPVTIAYIIAPQIFKGTDYAVDVEIGNGITAGQTVVDVYNITKKPKNVFFIESANVEAFWDLMLAALGEACKNSPLK
eukprot:TRINITY_DN853_c1_g1_i1.p1 TRINITY_DN853_c1_g1~~TRINITY_DN853_c1_g1_i1.p1  ORF type:complete len:326 (+),score=133.84 TRINITY_DN853_c1_g1_i1:72-1049(+)